MLKLLQIVKTLIEVAAAAYVLFQVVDEETHKKRMKALDERRRAEYKKIT